MALTQEEKEKLKRRREWIAVAVLGFFFVLLTLAEFRLSRISSTLPFVNSIFFFGLLNVNIIILIALVWLVFRNVGKVFIERRSQILGSRLKTKLVISFLGFSIIPTLTLFFISALYINSSFDKWFSIKIQNTLQASLDITQTFYKNSDSTAMHFAEHLSSLISRRLPGGGSLEGLGPFLRQQRELLALDAVEFYSDPLDERLIAHRPLTTELNQTFPRLPLDLLDRAFNGEQVSAIHHVGSGDLIRCLFPIKLSKTNKVVGITVVNTYIPASLINKADEIASVFDDYRDVNPLKYPMKTTYFVILIMITLVILVVATWAGLYIARELTVPVERLVQGAKEVGAGNLDVTVQSVGKDEISVLVESFNKMTHDLRDNREMLTQASADLEKRRMQLETVLANVGTGVLVVDRNGEITTFNFALSQLLQIPQDQALGKNFHSIFSGETEPLERVVRRSLAIEGPITQIQAETLAKDTAEQWTFKGQESSRNLSAIATPLWGPDSSRPWGVVIAVDDMTTVVKGQREMAWREVAKRIAHEIKNPLTPIKLSAQRLQRRLGHFQGQDAVLLKECTETIVKHTDELKEMVNEFSNFARFPEASPAPHDLNSALSEVTRLFDQAHPEVHLSFEPDPSLPIFEFDRDQMKRVLINLLDNAVGALAGQNDKPKVIRVQTRFRPELEMAILLVQDNGPGMDDEVKDRVFEPYFSTKEGGTGLGLSIVKRIVNDHDGFVRVQSATAEGTQFLVELPTRISDRQPRRNYF
ncbi:MAG: HAMP domain-containing protein [Bdellovibrionales bacterium]|nr:HAMP domain-containing protein [Bdellovibrionales bacterium]